MHCYQSLNRQWKRREPLFAFRESLGRNPCNVAKPTPNGGGYQQHYLVYQKRLTLNLLLRFVKISFLGLFWTRNGSQCLCYNVLLFQFSIFLSVLYSILITYLVIFFDFTMRSTTTTSYLYVFIFFVQNPFDLVEILFNCQPFGFSDRCCISHQWRLLICVISFFWYGHIYWFFPTAKIQ